MNLELAADREMALTVACPYPPCLAQIGDPCRNREGQPLVSQAAHLTRLRLAGVRHEPCDPDELAARGETTEGWRKPRPSDAYGGSR